ncbi:MAG: glycosyltransferase family 4 protein [bacterium]|nr:glycosyltransferase family 4 protein [bacterium]
MRRIAVIGHMHVNPDNRELFELLTETDEVDFYYPKKWTGSFDEKYENEEGFSLLKLPLKNSYVPFFKAKGNYDIVWIDEEPYYPQTSLMLDIFKEAPVKIVRTAQNIEKRSLLRNIQGGIAAKKTTMFVSVGRTSSETAKKLYRRNDVPIVPLPVADRFFEAVKRRNTGEGPLRIGFASRLVRCKGTEWLVQSLKRVTQEYILVVAGDGEDRASFLRELDKMNVRFEYRGLVKHSEMDSFYLGVDLFVNLSVSSKGWVEQQGRGVLEAMASGCAVISSDSGELKYTILDDDAKIPEGDCKALSDRLNNLLKDSSSVAKLAYIQKKNAEKFSKYEVFKSLYGVLKNV